MPKDLACPALSEDAIQLIAARFRVLGEASRLKLVVALEKGEKNVSQLMKAAGLNQANASRHLRTLTDAGVLSRRRKGIEVYYALAVPGIFEFILKVSRELEQSAKVKPGDCSSPRDP